jgi:anaerobic ribonucleoside-triphosphate reductase activating protein
VDLNAPWLVHATLPRSRANGPGLRYVIWSQGCGLACAGCFNPETHARRGPVRTAGALAEAVLTYGDLDGVTLTGGEPLEQPGPVTAFCRAIRAGGDLGIIVLTGFTRAEIEADPARRAAVADADLVIAGRYNARRHLGTGLRGSANKVYWARTARYTPADLAAVPDVEILIAPDGTTVMTGMP